MYTPTTPQAPRGDMTRPRTYAIGHKVNSLLFEPSLSTCETWLLPHAWTLHILRYNRDDHGGSKDQGQAWKRRRKRTWPLQNERYNRSTTAREVQPADYRPTTGLPSVIERRKAGTTPDVPVTTRRPVLPPRQPVQPLAPFDFHLQKPVPDLPAVAPLSASGTSALHELPVEQPPT